jgi:hypothetical protein
MLAVAQSSLAMRAVQSSQITPVALDMSMLVRAGWHDLSHHQVGFW